MLFGVVSAVGRVMGVLDGVVIVEGKGQSQFSWVNVGASNLTNGDGDELFPNYCGNA